jgi:hypothetical protein
MHLKHGGGIITWFHFICWWPLWVQPCIYCQLFMWVYAPSSEEGWQVLPTIEVYFSALHFLYFLLFISLMFLFVVCYFFLIYNNFFAASPTYSRLLEGSYNLVNNQNAINVVQNLSPSLKYAKIFFTTKWNL